MQAVLTVSGTTLSFSLTYYNCDAFTAVLYKYIKDLM